MFITATKTPTSNVLTIETSTVRRAAIKRVEKHKHRNDKRNHTRSQQRRAALRDD